MFAPGKGRRLEILTFLSFSLILATLLMSMMVAPLRAQEYIDPPNYGFLPVIRY